MFFLPEIPLDKQVLYGRQYQIAIQRKSEAIEPISLWEEKNRQRLVLIDKEFRQGLTFSEAEELEILQSFASEYMHARHPLPFDQLEYLEDYACGLEHRG